MGEYFFQLDVFDVNTGRYLFLCIRKFISEQMGDLISKETIERVKRDNCFDFLRYFFAFSLILTHFCTLTDTEQFWFITGQMRVKAFFTITGFLVVYSFLRRNNLKVYCRKRILRIIPAYVTMVLLCYLAGGLFSDAPLKEYYLSLQSAKYMAANLSFLNYLEPCLPGLFTDNFYGPFVNGSLWSMKYEVLFYCFVPVLIWLMRRYNKLYVLIAVFVGLLTYNTFYSNSLSTIIYFFSGTAILLYFDWFCRNIRWILPVCILYLGATFIFGNHILYYLEPFAFSAVIVGIAYFCKPLNVFRRFDNISYGLYLYHFPVIQVLVQYDIHHNNIYIAFLLALIITTLLALASWYIIEKPMLKRE